MTDNPLVEAVARAMTNKTMAGVHPSYSQRRDMATAALRAIEDAGWKVVPVEPTPDMEIAATEDWMTIRAAEDRAAAIWSAMLKHAPSFTEAGDSAK